MRQTCAVAERFQERVASLAPQDPADPGELAPGAMEFLREIFDERGPVPVEDVERARQERQIELARAAVELLGADHGASTDVQPLRIAWPICAEHGGQPMAPPNLYEAPNGLIDGTASWWCKQAGGHEVAPVGQLTSRKAKTR